MDYIRGIQTPLGPMTMASDGEALTGLWFDGQKYDRAHLSEDVREQDLPVFAECAAWLKEYFSGRDPGFIPALHLRVTPFQREVLNILQNIPYGKTMTYGQIAALLAKQLGKKTMSAQAVGSAVGHNPVSLIIPCHRVIGADGSLTGYAGGIDKKRSLLEMEGVHLQ
ncbi:MAG: methylated-DNA--[protein]-cysteine S-methyltransferase [Solobacterium sp.]|nr:methylated-DNA--[protein]-cysteine S-methyltransferase [Solobacterium sp.]